MTDFFEFSGVDDAEIRRERAKAKELRKSGWWQRKISTGVCYYCGNQYDPRLLTMDHIVPLGRGGRSVKANLVAACKECNTQKKTLLPLEWEAYMAKLGRQG